MKGLKWSEGLRAMKKIRTTIFAWLVGGAVLVYLGVFGVGTGSCTP